MAFKKADINFLYSIYFTFDSVAYNIDIGRDVGMKKNVLEGISGDDIKGFL